MRLLMSSVFEKRAEARWMKFTEAGARRVQELQDTVVEIREDVLVVRANRWPDAPLGSVVGSLVPRAMASGVCLVVDDRNVLQIAADSMFAKLQAAPTGGANVRYETFPPPPTRPCLPSCL